MAGELIALIIIAVVLILLWNGDSGGSTEQPNRGSGNNKREQVDTKTNQTTTVDGRQFDTDTSAVEDYAPDDR